jgi:ankyrin repeat protein
LLDQKRDVFKSVQERADTVSEAWALSSNGGPSDSFSLFSFDINDKRFDFDDEIMKLGPYRRVLQAQSKQQSHRGAPVPNLIDDDLLDLSFEDLTPGPWTQELQQNFSTEDTQTVSLQALQLQDHDDTVREGPCNQSQSSKDPYRVPEDSPSSSIIQTGLSMRADPQESAGDESMSPEAEMSSNASISAEMPSASTPELEPPNGEEETPIIGWDIYIENSQVEAGPWTLHDLDDYQFSSACIENMRKFAPIHYAAFTGDATSIKQIFQTMDSVAIHRKLTSLFESHIPVRFAAMAGHVETVALIECYGNFSNYKDLNGMNALHCAIIYGHKDVVKYLLLHGYADSTCNLRGNILGNKIVLGRWNILSLASHFGHLGVVEEVLKSTNLSGQNQPPSDTETIPALHAAVHSILYLILAADPTLNKSETKKCLFYSLFSDLYSEIPPPMVGLFQRLGGAGPEIPNIVSRLKIIDLLCKSGISINAVDAQGLTALEAACFGPSVLVIERLLTYGARVSTGKRFPSQLKTNARQYIRDGPVPWSGMYESPLHLAALLDRKEIVEILLNSNDVDPNINGYEERRPLHYAAAMGSLQVISTLIAAGANVDSEAHRVIKSSEMRLITPLMVAAKQCQTEAMVALINAGAEIRKSIYWFYYTEGEKRMETILNRVARMKNLNISVVKTLLEQGAPLNARDDRMRTPLHNCYLRNTDIVAAMRLFIERGADPNAKDFEGNTPLQLTLRFRSVNEWNASEVVKALLSWKADPYLKNSRGNDAFDMVKSALKRREIRKDKAKREDFEMVSKILNEARRRSKDSSSSAQNKILRRWPFQKT